MREALDYALFLGYRHIDTAISYDNDIEIGEVIQDRISSRKLKRKDIFVTTKVQNLYANRNDLLDKVHETKDNLKLQKLDMLLIHHPWEVVYKDETKKNTENVELELAPYVNFCNTWRFLEELHSDGSARHIGLSNFTEKQISKILKIAKVMPSNLQLEAHAYFQQKNLKQFCNSKDIVVSAYAPLGAPDRPSRHINGNGNVSLLEDPTIVDIAKSYKRTPGQILLNFLLCRGIAVLPKSGNRQRLEENMDVYDWSLSVKDFTRIVELDRGVRFFQFAYIRGHPEFFENEEF